jgi:hypothetical protein
MSGKTCIVAAMSGGVDSAVVVGVTMKMYLPTRPAHAKSCCEAEDFDDARRSAATLGIPHYVLDFEKAFRCEVVDRFVDDYRNSLIVGRGSFVDWLRTDETRRAILFEEQAVQALIRLVPLTPFLFAFVEIKLRGCTPAATPPFSTRLGAFRRRGVEKPLSRLVSCYLRKTTARLRRALRGEARRSASAGHRCGGVR